MMDKGYVGWSPDFKAIPGLHGPVTEATIAILKQVQDARVAGWRAGVGDLERRLVARLRGGLSAAVAFIVEEVAARLLAEGEGGEPK